MPLSHAVLFVAIAGVAAQGPKLKTQDGNVVADLSSTGGDFGVAKGNGPTEYWGDLTSRLTRNADAVSAVEGDVISLERVTRQIHNTLGNGSVVAALDRIAAAAETRNGLLQDIVAHNALARSGLAASASVVGTNPNRVSARGGSLEVGGRGFIPNLDGLYTCVVAARGGRVLRSVGAPAQNANRLECGIPAWPVDMTTAAVAANVTVEENGVELASARVLALTIYAEPPSMTAVPSTSITYSDDVTNGRYIASVNVVAPTGPAAHITVSGTSSNTSCIASVSVGNHEAQTGTGVRKAVALVFASGVEACETDITLIAVDRLGLNSSQTFSFESTSGIGASTAGLLYYNGFDASNCQFPNYPTSINSNQVQRSSWCSTSGGARIFNGGGNSRGAQFNNQDSHRIEYQRSANIVLGNTWTISVWVKSNTCSNNQIPLFFRTRTGTSIYMIDHHARARMSNGFIGRNHYGGTSCRGWEDGWKHHVYQDTGSRFRVWVDGTEQSLATNNRNANGGMNGAWLQYLGSRPGFGTNGLGGYLDEMVIWNRVLTPEEVAGMYALRGSSIKYGVNL
jgi:hypothetical protein